MGYLIFRSAGPQEPVAIGDNGLVVGRSPDCDVTVQDTQLSRKHFRIFKAGAECRIEDLGSANGTQVNGQKIATAQILSPGDLIEVGPLAAVFSLEPTAPPATTVGGKGGPHFKLRSAPENTKIPTVIPLGKDRLTLGRRPGNDIVIKATVVSGQHCELLREGDSYRIRDLGSTNGLKINGEKVDSALLNPGDVVAIDTLVMVFQDPERAATPAAAKLRVIEGTGAIGTPEITLGRATISFGRKAGNTFAIKDDSELSGQHCKIYRDDATGRYLIADLGSTNGTRVDGQKLEPNVPIPLGNGSKIKLGGIILSLEDASAPAPKRASGRQTGRQTKPAAATAPTAKLDLDRNDTLDDEVVFDDDLGGEMNLDDDGDAGGDSETRAVALGSGSEPADLEADEKRFLASTGGKKKSRGLQRAIEASIVLLILGVGGFVLYTATQSGPQQSTGGATDVPVPSGSKITTNWSFEKADESASAMPGGWEFEGGSGDAAVRSTTIAKSGTCALEIVRDNPEYNSTDCFSADVIEVPQGQAISVKAVARKFDGNGGAVLKLEFYRDAGTTQYVTMLLSEAIGSANDWVDIAISAVPPAEGRFVRVACSAVGSATRVAFDDVSAMLGEAGENAVSPGTPKRVKHGQFEWELAPTGGFALVQHTADGQEFVMVDAEPTFSARPSGLPFARLSDMSLDRVVSVDESGAAPQITVKARVLEPFDAITGQKMPANSLTLVLGFESDWPTISVQMGTDAAVTETGIVAWVPNYRTSAAVGRFAEGRGPRERELAFHHMPVKPMGGTSFKAYGIAIPRGTAGHLSLTTASQRDGLFDALADEGTARFSFRQMGKAIAVHVDVNPHAAAIADFYRRAEQAMQAEQYGAAIAHTLSALELSLHDAEAIATAGDQVTAIMARLRYRIDEYKENMEALKINFSRERFIRTQSQMQELLASIDMDAIAQAPRDFLTAFQPGKLIGAADRADAGAYVQYLTRIWEDLNLLDSVPKQFEELNQAKRADVDAATLARWEEDGRPLLARAIDYEQAGFTAMALAAYRQVLDVSPFSRTATVARAALVRLANAMVVEAAAEQAKWPQSARDKNYLARDIALAVRRDVWVEAGAFWDEKLNDPDSGIGGTWGRPRAAEFVGNFYQIEAAGSRSTPTNTRPEWQIIWPDPANEWWTWNNAQWKAAERQARADASAILAGLSDLPALPDPGTDDGGDGGS